MSSLTKITLSILPTFIIFQPFFGIFSQIILYGVQLGLPSVALYYLKKRINLILLFFFFIFLISVSLDEIVYYFDFFRLNIVLIITSAILFRAGYFISKYKYTEFFNYLVIGASLANLAILISFLTVFLGLIDVSFFYDPFDRDARLGIFRFTIGNAIEAPFLICSLLAAGIARSSFGSRILALLLILNLVLALISQSRIVILISFFMLLTQIKFSNFIIYILFGLIAFFYGEIVLDYSLAVFDSLFSRFTGDDYGSQTDRLNAFSMVFDNIDGAKLIWGGGIASSAELFLLAEGNYRTVESVFLQFIYETGLIGTFIYYLILTNSIQIRFKLNILNIVLILIAIEQFGLLPIFGSYPLVMFSLGALLAANLDDKKNI